MSSFLSPLVKKAFYYAAEKHDGQCRKGSGTPFFVHPALVALGISTYTKDENTIAAAVLHDIIEDCRVSASDLSKLFNETVSQLVAAVSLPLPDTEKMGEWKERKGVYLEHIYHASPEALLIIGVDKMLNMKGYFEQATSGNIEVLNTLFNGTIEDYLWYYGEIENIIHAGLGDHPAAKDYRDLLQHYRSALNAHA